MPKVPHRKSSESAQSEAPRSDLLTGSSGSLDKKFQFQWYDDFPEWRLWVRPVKDNNTLFYCCACKKAFACGKSNIQSHENTTKHTKALGLLKFDNERMSSQIASHNNLNDSLPSMHNVFDDECTETSSFGSVPVLDSLPSEAFKETNETLKSKDLDFTGKVSLVELRLALFFVEKNISFEVGKDLVELL